MTWKWNLKNLILHKSIFITQRSYKDYVISSVILLCFYYFPEDEAIDYNNDNEDHGDEDEISWVCYDGCNLCFSNYLGQPLALQSHIVLKKNHDRLKARRIQHPGASTPALVLIWVGWLPMYT